MFGRSILMDDYGLTIGVIPMDKPKVTAGFHLLGKIVDQVASSQVRPSSGSGAENVSGIGKCELVKPPTGQKDA